MKRPRILLTVDAVGGVWQYSTELARALGDEGYDTVLAIMGPGPTPDQLARAEAIPHTRIVDTGLGLDWLAHDAASVTQAGDRIAKLADESAADIVQLNMPALAAGTRFAVPVVAMAHSCVATWWSAMRDTSPSPEFRWRTALTSKGLRAAARVVAPSAAFADATMQAYKLPMRPAVVHNGRSPFPTMPRAMHDAAFTAGRLWDQAKNVAVLDRAAGRLGIPFHAAGPLIGPNGERLTVENLHTIGIADDARMATMLASRPVFVSAAKYEPFGLAVLEAAAAGCALVLSDIPTFRELWGEAAVFVPADNDRGFARAIEAVIGDEAWRLSLGTAARGVAATFTPRAMARGMTAIYQPLLSQDAVATSAVSGAAAGRSVAA